ncbi:hypothetical protein C0Q70_13687 [Pomacea canaliculata]|uniref:Triokinase/FMN cyclase n=1 Tax=Pomacea canaliculata TaxID=400727 RepID=A0A2T7NXX5_POMCA|nr:hypothetical protein C0Q70_13687 [Pomacea canaliculata]
MSTKANKKLINCVETCVEDNLEGYVALNPGVRLLKGHRIAVRADIEEYQTTGKVAVLCGGGSGHEPAFAGYVGQGMLTGAVMGSVFAAPPSTEVLVAIRALSRHNAAGCFFLIPNYTGDRLNFGLAAERAREEGLRVETQVTGEDRAVNSADRTSNRRGVTGIVVTIKIAGSLAEEGRGAEEIKQVVCQALDNMGAHGEAGVQRLKIKSAKDTVELMLNHLTSPSNANRLSLTKGDRVALFVNDTGGISQMELNIMAREAILYLESRDIRVVRAYCSNFVTSLDMAGLHLTVLVLDETLTRCLDAPTQATGWPRVLLGPGMTDRLTLPPLKLDYIDDIVSDNTQEAGLTLSTDEAEKLRAAITAACLALTEAESNLNHLDSGAGDGDCGSTLARGAKAVLKELEKDECGELVSRPSLLARRLAAIADATMGGASGGLYGLFFTGAASAFTDGSEDRWQEAIRQGMALMRRYGGAEPGDRTMLDALNPVWETLSLTQREPPLLRFEKAVQAAERGADNTKEMTARAGRACNVSASILQHPDPGAVGVAVWLRAAYTAYTACGASP